MLVQPQPSLKKGSPETKGPSLVPVGEAPLVHVAAAFAGWLSRPARSPQSLPIVGRMLRRAVGCHRIGSLLDNEKVAPFEPPLECVPIHVAFSLRLSPSRAPFNVPFLKGTG